jgi:acyl dehydratase
MADLSSTNVGDVLPSKSLSVDQALINEYADICGDYNTLHVDVEKMKDHPLFGGTIAHGTINVEPVLQAICEVQGTKWPNAGTTIDLQFRAPVKPGMTITSDLKVKEKTDTGLVCDMQILDQDGKPCVRGSVEITA